MDEEVLKPGSHAAGLRSHDAFVEELTDEIRAEMRRRGMTDEDLAERLRMPKPKIEVLLNGECSLCALAEVCLVLGIRPECAQE